MVVLHTQPSYQSLQRARLLNRHSCKTSATMAVKHLFHICILARHRRHRHPVYILASISILTSSITDRQQQPSSNCIP
jgi:hypothetical protein